MKNAVIYYTKLGHSKKIAQAIAQELRVKAQDVCNNPKLDQIDRLYIVSGIYGGVSAPELVAYLKSLNPQQVKQAFLLTSSGGKTSPATNVRAILTELGIPVSKEEFTCQGAIFLFGLGHPNKVDLQNAVAFVKSPFQQAEQS